MKSKIRADLVQQGIVAHIPQVCESDLGAEWLQQLCQVQIRKEMPLRHVTRR